MKHLNVLTLAVLLATLIGCATTQPEKDTVAAAEALPQPAPSYSEQVVAQPLTQVNGANCPTDSKWESLEWKAVVPLANACVKNKDWLRVEKIGNHLAKKAYLAPWGPYYMALSAENRHDYPRAVWMLELALKKDPKEGLFHYELGRIHWELKEDHEALQHLKMASDLNPSLTGAHYVMGEMAMQRQDFTGAENLFNKALAVDSKHLPSILALASINLNRKDWSKGEEYLDRALKLSPNSGKVRLALAQVQEEHLKKLQEALKNYKQLRQLRAERKMVEPVEVNLDQRIQVLEKSLAGAPVVAPSANVRTPSAERSKQ